MPIINKLDTCIQNHKSDIKVQIINRTLMFINWTQAFKIINRTLLSKIINRALVFKIVNRTLVYKITNRTRNAS